MPKHLTQRLAPLVAILLLAVPYCIKANAADAPAKNEYNTIDTNLSGLGDQPPPPPPKKPQEDAPKKTKYDKLPLTELTTKAEAGDLTAQFELASRHNYGRNMPKNTALALRWLRKAAEAGQADARKLLAIKLYSGYDVAPNYKEALKWANKLAETGDAAAAIMIGNMYANGDGSKRNLVRACTWYTIAAAGEQVSEDDPAITDEQLAQNGFIKQAAEQRDKTAGLLSAREETLAQKNASAWWMKHQDRMAKIKAEKTMQKAAEEAEMMPVAKANKR